MGGRSMKVAIGCDHGGFEHKEAVKKHLESKKIKVIDVGTDSKESVDYPIFGIAVAEKVRDKKADFGIVICTSGEGITIAANKVKGIRAGIGYNDDVSRLIREHNNANVIGFGGSQMKVEDVLRRVDIFLSTKFDGGERHQRRVKLISDYENK